ncbi:hypothetical protein D3C84_1043670 [compost metagenome]
MELAHPHKYIKHGLGSLRGFTPVLPAKGKLRDLLPRTKAIINRTSAEADLPKLGMNAAPEIGLEVRARMPGILVVRKIR